MEIWGFIASIIMGLSLGLIGGGGSILTVPILVYLFHVDPLLSTAYSLFVVGITSALGSFSHFKKGNVHLKTAFIFGMPSIMAVYTIRKFVVPIIPDPVFSLDSLIVSRNLFIMIVFALLMVFSAVSMIKKSKFINERNENIKHNLPLIFFEGIIVGGITGFVGAGGGFLIIPALVLFAGLPMKQAVGTSLLIIAMKSLIGFTGDLGTQILDFRFMALLSMFATIGIILGSYISKYISNEKLKPVFGWFVMTMGVFILTKEIFFHG
jgi:uncharacterized membrane protein YfcA